jgi:hypothetical protein
LQWLAARSIGYTRCPLCGLFQGPRLAGYAITTPGGSVDSVPVCDRCAGKHSFELIPAREAANDAAADEAARVRWRIERGEAEPIPEGTPMTIGERLDALEQVEEKLRRRQIAVIDIDCCPTDHSELAEEVRRRVEDGDVSPGDLRGVACIRSEDEEAVRRGEEFGIHVTLPPGHGGRDAERRVRAVAQVVHEELLVANIPHTWDGGKVLWVSTRQPYAQDARAVAAPRV